MGFVYASNHPKAKLYQAFEDYIVARTVREAELKAADNWFDIAGIKGKHSVRANDFGQWLAYNSGFHEDN